MDELSRTHKKIETCKKNEIQHSGRNGLGRRNKKTVIYNTITEQKKAAALRPGVVHTILHTKMSLSTEVVFYVGLISCYYHSMAASSK